MLPLRLCARKQRFSARPPAPPPSPRLLVPLLACGATSGALVPNGIAPAHPFSVHCTSLIRVPGTPNPLYLSPGTLLGAARAGKIIPYTDDNDLLIPAPLTPAQYQTLGDRVEAQSHGAYYVQVCPRGRVYSQLLDSEETEVAG